MAVLYICCSNIMPGWQDHWTLVLNLSCVILSLKIIKCFSLVLQYTSIKLNSDRTTF